MAALEAMEARITALMEAGRAHRADVSQVVSRVATARAQREKARGQFELLKLRLKVLTGVSTSQELVLIEAFAGVSPGTEVSFEQALVERGELKLARMKAGLAQTQVDAASRGLWPQVVLQGGYTLANPNERYFPASAEFNDSWDVSVVMSWVVWDFGVNLGERRVAQARARAAEHEVEHLQQMTEFAVEQTAIELENADREIVAAAESVTAARQTFEVIQQRFEEGRATATDVLTAELDVTRAAAEVVQLEAARQMALARLKRFGALSD
ncbi:MAG: TolC family protein [bacterium]